MNIIETLEREEIARLGKTLTRIAPGDTVRYLPFAELLQ